MFEPFKYFPDPATTTEDEAKVLRKRLARQYHPDLDPANAETMSAINAEYERWIRFKENPPILVAAPTNPWASGADWWSAMVGAVKQVPIPDTPPPPPATATTRTRAPRNTTPPPTPGPPPVRPTRTTTPGPRVPLAQREQQDYDAALQMAPDAHGHKVYGLVTILYTSYLGGLTVEALEIRGSHPRHQIRENGIVVFERPATTRWKQERKDLIARASARNY